jgi:glycosyltransferase involved in cell wall biosynthesis
MKKKPNLLIVSDTKMFRTENKWYAFNSVVKELDVFVDLFDKITWIGFEEIGCSPDSTLLEIKYSHVKCVGLKKSGGNSFLAKFKLLFYLPIYIVNIFWYSRSADIIHSRGPSSPMFCALILSFFQRKSKWWFKYANNWNDINAAASWKLQRRLLILNNKSIVTVNGIWNKMPPHILSFENPCLEEVIIPYSDDKNRTLNEGCQLLFVGRLELKKGLLTVIEAVESNQSKTTIERIEILGDGNDKEFFLTRIRKSMVAQKFFNQGLCSKEEVLSRMRNSDFLLLPSVASEGFPKVLAEAWASGCIPVVSDVSCVSQYAVDGVNSFVWGIRGIETYSDVLNRALNTDVNELIDIRKAGREMCSYFTYSRYKQRIEKEIIQYFFCESSLN